jgi:hypothetical protein
MKRNKKFALGKKTNDGKITHGQGGISFYALD